MLQRDLDKACHRLFDDGLEAAIVSDKDGVIILKSISKDAPEYITEPAIFTTFGFANSQASKLGLNHNKCIVSMYNQFQVVHVDQNPIIITIIGKSAANTGLLMNLGKRVAVMTQDLSDTLRET